MGYLWIMLVQGSICVTTVDLSQHDTHAVAQFNKEDLLMH